MAPFMLVFEGSRTASSETETFALGFRDEGLFTALAPMCDTGLAVAIENRLADGWMTELRRFECGGGAGSIIARTWLLDGDPSLGYEAGAWLIVAGTGAYEGLRGKGTYVRAFLEGEPASIAEVWRGLVDYDDTAPEVALGKISVTTPHQPGGAYLIRLRLSARDPAGGQVTFLVTARSSILLAAKYDTAPSGSASVVLRMRPRAGERRVRLEVAANDQVGNERTVVRVLNLPRP